MFSDIAKKNMLARIKDSDYKVGSQYVVANPWGDYSKFTQTDCITFVLNVLKDTYKQLKQPEVITNLISESMVKRGNDKSPKFYGDMLARNLVSKRNWTAIYLTPDRFHPNDAKQEHTFATAQVVKTCNYTGVPVSYLALDYNPTGTDDPSFQKLFSYKGPRALNLIGLNELRKIKFGFGISRKGDHTWLFSEGYVYEAHWDKISNEIFEKRAIEKFPWNSNLIVVPPDAIGLLNTNNLKLCKN